MIKTRMLSKKYGKKFALDNFDFSCNVGEIIGVLGPNGSGKSTFLRIVSGIIPQTAGSVIINEYEPSKHSKKLISYLPDTNHLPGFYSIDECIYFYKKNFSDFNLTRYKNYCDIMKLPSGLEINSLSRGILQKLRIALCLSRDCKFYLLDEPLSGIDPVSREVICNVISQSICDESSIIITTHLISEIEHILDRIVFIHNGKSIYEISCDELRDKNNMSVNDLYKEVFKNA